MPSFLWAFIPFILIGVISTIAIYNSDFISNENLKDSKKENKIENLKDSKKKNKIENLKDSKKENKIENKIFFYLCAWICALILSGIFWTILFYFYNPSMFGIIIVKNIFSG